MRAGRGRDGFGARGGPGDDVDGFAGGLKERARGPYLSRGRKEKEVSTRSGRKSAALASSSLRGTAAGGGTCLWRAFSTIYVAER